MRLLVTGSKGFIGSHLQRHLERHKIDMVAYDGELTRLPEFDKPCNAVVHLAARVLSWRENSNTGDLDDLIDKVNVDGTQAVLQYARKHKASLVFPSSCAVYGLRHSDAPISENAPLKPVRPNGRSKLAAENLIRAYREVPATILRLFNVYGPGQRPGFLVPNLAQHLNEGKALSLDMPQAVRDFVFVDDVVQAIIAAVTSERSDAIGIYNIGSGHGIEVRQLCALASKLTGKPLKLEPGKFHDQQAEAMVADISAATRDLRWEPKTSLEIGLKQTLSTF